MVAAGCSDCGKGPEPENAEIQFVADKTALENTFNNTFDFEVRLDASNTQEVTVEYKTGRSRMDWIASLQSQAAILFKKDNWCSPQEKSKRPSASPLSSTTSSSPKSGSMWSCPIQSTVILKGNQQIATGDDFE